MNVSKSYEQILKNLERPCGYISVTFSSTLKDCGAVACAMLDRVQTDDENDKILIMTFSQSAGGNQSMEHMRERVRVYQFAIGHAEMLKTKLESEGFTFTEIDE